MSLAKDHKYYPCTNCRYKNMAGMTTCPFANKGMCPLYKACEVLVCLAESKDKFADIPVDLVIDILRSKGYSGELRQTKIVNI